MLPPWWVGVSVGFGVGFGFGLRVCRAGGWFCGGALGFGLCLGGVCVDFGGVWADFDFVFWDRRI